MYPIEVRPRWIVVGLPDEVQLHFCDTWSWDMECLEKLRPHQLMIFETLGPGFTFKKLCTTSLVTAGPLHLSFQNQRVIRSKTKRVKVWALDLEEDILHEVGPISHWNANLDLGLVL